MDKIKSLAIKYKNILQNFSYLTILQVFNLFFPVIIYPFFIDLFGLDLWGKIVLAQSLAFFLAIFVDFGYDRYATKEISIHRNNFKKLSEISSCVILIRVVLGIIVFNLFAIVVYNAPFFKGDEVLYLVSFFVNFNFILFPKWFFLGMERMKYIVLINVSVKVLFVILMYVFIKDKSDYLLVPLFFGLGAFVGGLIGIKMLFSFKGISFKIYPFKMYYHYIKSSYLLFASALVISIKDRFNIFIVGYFLGMQEVAIYDIGMKLVSLIMQPIESVNGAIFPKVAKELNMDFVKVKWDNEVLSQRFASIVTQRDSLQNK
ncbi:MAG: oligosaccharide flippase family protein, partial [Bacteroidota bacterium]